MKALAPALRGSAQAARGLGFGLGLRAPHFPDFLRARQPVEWLEAITENFLIDGGRPLHTLRQLRRDHPIALHGVGMSIGSVGGLDLEHLARVKALSEQIEPLWVSDHLCWTGGPGPEQLHDLYPLPYTEEAARLVVRHIKEAQDLLGRRLVLENVSSYLAWPQSQASEWEFLAHVAQASDCLLLVDVNNIYVSSRNHGFDPLAYLHALPASRVQQIHLAGHSGEGRELIDTHDEAVCDGVWALYEEAITLWGDVPTMIERDAKIPPLPELLEELNEARRRSAVALGRSRAGDAGASPSVQRLSIAPPAQAEALMAQHLKAFTPLKAAQTELSAYVLQDEMEPSAASPAHALVQAMPRATVYHHAYRARLAEVLADTFSKTRLFVGSDQFEAWATEHAVRHPPLTRTLNTWGEAFVAELQARHPDHPELFELAQLEWDLRSRFDGEDVPALTAAAAQADASLAWLQRAKPLHPSLVLRPLRSNAPAIWQAIDTDTDVPEARQLAGDERPHLLAVWRLELQPQFQTLSPEHALIMRALNPEPDAHGQPQVEAPSVARASETLAQSGALSSPSTLAQWLQSAWALGWLRA